MQFEQAGEFITNKLRNELPGYLTYHNIEHTLDVLSAAQNIGKGENITDSDMGTLLTAAFYHDAGFLKAPEGHEAESCRIAKDVLPGFGYATSEIDLICEMIMATRLPQSPKNHLECILADADLDYLGRDDFFTIGDKLFHEFCLHKTVTDRNEWNKLQLQFMEDHSYFTKTAINLRQPKKEANMQLIKAQLNCDTK